MPNSHPFVQRVNELLQNLNSDPSANNGVELANEILKLVGVVDIKSAEEVFESSLELPNAERYDRWFQPHPIFKSDRACFELAENELLQAKFYWLQKHTRQIIAGGVHFTPNFEDEDFTHNERYKVGVDFFLSPNGKSLQVVLSNRGNLRVVELSTRLNSTQVDIFSKWDGAGRLSTQEALHTTLWDSFKLKSVNQKFYDGVANSFNELLQHLKSIDKDDEEAKLFASRLLGRLLFCWFLRKKGIIDEDVGYFNAQGLDSTTYYKSKLERLFFLTLNTPVDERDELQRQHQQQLIHLPAEDKQPSLFKTDQKTPYLNGGLFEPHENDWFNDAGLTLPEGYFVNLYNHFDEFNFTTDESSPEYEQIAIDPEMLGRVFESLLATQIDETGQQARKAKGAFYTPREIVSYMCKESLRNYLYRFNAEDERYKKAINDLLDTSDREWAGAGTNSKRDSVPKEYRTQIINNLDEVKVLDPACGSGAFPMGMLQLCLRTYERVESRFDPYVTKLQIIQKNIFGVDIEPMAVEIARLRAWLSLIVDEEDGRTVEPLPNLDFKFLCANSLIPLEVSNTLDLWQDADHDKKLAAIRNDYFSAKSKARKDKLKKNYFAITNQTDLNRSTRTIQLNSFNPFDNSHPAEFFDADQMFGLEGFDLVIGNPPYISALAAKKIISSSTRDKYKELYVSAKGAYDMYLIFFERGINLLKPSGLLAYISPTKYVSAKYAEAFRAHLGKQYILKLADFSNTKVFESACVSTLVTFLNNNDLRDNVVTEKYDSSDRNTVKIIDTPTESLDEFPENLWGHLISGNYKLLSKIYSSSDILSSLAEVNGSSTASEGDRFSNYIVEEESTNSLRVVNTGNISQYRAVWGEKEYSNRRKKILKPYIMLENIGQRRVDMYKSQKIIISKLAKKLTAMIDAEGTYASTNTTFIYSPKGNLDLIALTGLLNSELMNFVYRSAFSGLNLLGSFQFQAPQIRLLPIHKDLMLKNGNYEILHKTVLELVNIKPDQPEFQEKVSIINKVVFEIYDLTPEEIAIVKESIK